MGTTSTFLKQRSTGTPNTGEWNINYKNALQLAQKNNKIIVSVWSNGDACGYCVELEKIFNQKVFIDWIKKTDCYFVFQYSGDKDKGQTLFDLIYKDKGSSLKYYPGIMIAAYNGSKQTYKKLIEGNKLRDNKTGTNGAKAVIANFEKFFKEKPAVTPPKEDTIENYKTRFNEKLTVAKVNSILDAIDKNGGYCPCQVKSAGTKCHCEDYIKNKKIGEPCICNLYVKQKK